MTLLYNDKLLDIHSVDHMRTNIQMTAEPSLLLIPASEADLHISGKCLHAAADSAVILNAGTVWSLEKNADPVLLLTLHLSAFLPGERENGLFFALPEAVPEVCSGLYRLAADTACACLEGRNRIRRSALSWQLMDLLYSRCTAAEPGTGGSSSRVIVQKASAYIQSHFHEPISSSDIAAECGITTTYLSSAMGKLLGMTPTALLKEYRLQEARLLLGREGMTVAETAEACGFVSPRSFSKAFQEAFGVLPSEWGYEPHDAPDRDVLRLLRKSPASAVDHSETDRCVQLPEISAAGRTEDFRLPLFRLLRFAKADSLLLPEQRESLKKLQNIYHYESVLLESIFDMPVLSWLETSGEIYWDFSRLDLILDYVLSLDLIPFIGIYSVPDVLVQVPSPLRYGVSNCTLPTNRSGWDSLLRSFMRHLLNRYGPKEMRRWRFSVWVGQETVLQNRHGRWEAVDADRITIQQALDFYIDSVRSIRSVYPEACIGSMAMELTTRSFSGQYISAFLEACRNWNFCPDYMDLYCYPLEELSVDGPSRKLQLSGSSAFQRRILEELIFKVRKQLGRVPLIFLTGWNTSPYFGDLLNDTAYKAAVTAAMVLDLPKEIQAISYSPIQDEVPFNRTVRTEFSGGPGLLTRSGILKPVLRCFWMLRRLGGQLLYRSDYACVTGNETGFQIFLYHSQDFRLQIEMGRIDRNAKIETRGGSVFKDGSGRLLWSTAEEADRCTEILSMEAIELTLTLTDLPCGQYKQVEHIVNHEYGNCHTSWQRIGCIRQFSQEDADYLNALSVPLVPRSQLTVTDGRLTLTRRLEACEVRLIELRRTDTNAEK